MTRIVARVKGKIDKVAVISAVMYGLETVGLTKRQKLKMLRFSLGVTVETKIGRVRWFRHVQVRNTGYVGHVLNVPDV